MQTVRSPTDAASLTADMLPHFQAWAPRITREYKRNAVADADDVASLCAETTFRLLTDERPETKPDDWYRYVYGACRHRVLTHFESGSVTAMTGMTEVMRRRRRRRRTQGEEESQATTDHAAQRDWIAASLLEHDEPTVDVHDFVLSEVEGRELVQMVIEACYERDDTLGQVADLWIGDTYSEPPVINSGADIGRALGVTNQRALTLLARVRKIASEVCESEFGLSGLF